MTDRLYVLAFDHRHSLMASFFGVEGEPSPEDVRRAQLAKEVIWQGLLRAVDQGVPRAAAAALVDATYGAEVIAAATVRKVKVAVPIEASGRRELAFEREDWRDRLDRLDPAWAKVLVRYNPDADPEMNARQRAVLAELDAHCRETARALMLELLVPPEPAQAGPEYDTVLRPGLMVRAIGEIRDAGVYPSVWKIEGLEHAGDCERVAGTTAAPCIVLGRGADRSAVDRWLRAGAGVPGYVGFAIGRTIWWDALARLFAGTCQRQEAVSAIASEYARYVDVYDAAVP